MNCVVVVVCMWVAYNSHMHTYLVVLVGHIDRNQLLNVVRVEDVECTLVQQVVVANDLADVCEK